MPNSGAVEPLTLRQRQMVIGLAIAVAATRFLAVSHSMWDWDEALFAATLHHYDVAQHHPHPPGFPLFFALAKLARVVIHDDFHALRAVSTLAALFVFPAMFALARSLRFRFRTCIIAALLFAFLPNVWYWGGTGFTDELAMVTAVGGAAFLLRDDRRRASYLTGCALFAATMLVRGQNVLLVWPWIVGSWRRLRERRMQVVAGTALIVVLVLTGYGIVAQLSGVGTYIRATKAHQRYVATVDGLFNPVRPPMRDLFYDFAFDPFQSYALTWGSRAVSILMIVFMLAALARPRRAHLHAILTFLPNFLLAWFFLSPTGISRLSLGYIALNALLAADGMDVIATFLAFLGSRIRAIPRERFVAALQILFAAAVIGRYIFWVWPALDEVRTKDSPPVQAMRWIGQNVPRGATIYLAGALEPMADYFLADYNVIQVRDDFDVSKQPPQAGAFVVADGPSRLVQAVNFQRPHRRLFALFHHRYFETSVTPAAGWINFGAGWYGEEQDVDGHWWRWMGQESHTLLGPVGSRALLGVSATFPLEFEPAPMVTIAFNGMVIDRFLATQRDVNRSYVVTPRGTPGELVISVDHSINLARLHRGPDPRELGLQLHNVTWKAQ
ncbi:MAG: hypothetical protein QOC81_3236 [Thermoanaerobaculia bacterium]|jgi:hypothetical protein|nr:hypothetical protein [Thermoanaerobaculia bacterium]